MNKNLKPKVQNTNKGITLVALIVTIIVLLILAIVAIQIVRGDGILAHSKNARDEYQRAQNNEIESLQSYEDYIAKNIYVVEVGKKAETNGTINGKTPSADNPIIPAGFIPINTETSKWEDVLNDQDNQSVKNGLVITDSIDADGNSNGNEFVWIPVKDINKMIICQNSKQGEEHKIVLKNNTLECTMCKENTKLAGKLYALDKEEAFNSSLTGQTYTQDSGMREPDTMNKYDVDENNLKVIFGDQYAKDVTTTEKFKEMLQTEFDTMAKSVAKYCGFYIARYEMSMKDNKAQSVANVAPTINAKSNGYTWFHFYNLVKTYSNESSNLGVISEMVWGCQYDAMMLWMEENNINIKILKPINTSTGKTAEGSATGKTGSPDTKDILNNVYDLLGGKYEWTQEAYNNVQRNYRGGRAGRYFSASRRGVDDYPTILDSTVTTRIALYIK